MDRLVALFPAHEATTDAQRGDGMAAQLLRRSPVPRSMLGLLFFCSRGILLWLRSLQGLRTEALYSSCPGLELLFLLLQLLLTILTAKNVPESPPLRTVHRGREGSVSGFSRSEALRTPLIWIVHC